MHQAQQKRRFQRALPKLAALGLGLLGSAVAHGEEPALTSGRLAASASLEPFAPSAVAQAPDQPHGRERQTTDTAAVAVSEGQLAPFSMAARIPSARADAKALFGFDSATSSSRGRGAVEGRVLDWLVVRVELEHGPGDGRADRAGIGARVGLLRQEQYGVDLGASFLYQADDFRGEGNFIGGLQVGRRFGRLELLANTLVGADSEGDDQSAELRLSGGYRILPAFQLGWDARGRMNLSTDSKRFGAQRVDWECQGGPSATVTFGPLALLVLAGPSALRLAAPTPTGDTAPKLRTGALAMAGLGGAF